jgi:hypothetical protein
LPLPSSPHWVPTTTVAGIEGLLGDGLPRDSRWNPTDES